MAPQELPLLNAEQAFERIRQNPSEAASIFRTLDRVPKQELLALFNEEKRTLVTAAQGWQ